MPVEDILFHNTWTAGHAFTTQVCILIFSSFEFFIGSYCIHRVINVITMLVFLDKLISIYLKLFVNLLLNGHWVPKCVPPEANILQNIENKGVSNC